MTHRMLIVAAMLIATSASWAQERTVTGSRASSGREYRLQAMYRAGIAQNYEVTETTSVVRTHSDSSKKAYSRKITYMMTVRCTENMNGFASLTANIDSLTYVFTANGDTVAYDSQKDITPKNFADLNNYVGPMNRSLEMKVNTYGEIQSVTGEQIDWIRTYLSDNASDIDSVLSLIWTQSVEDPNLLQYADLQKRVLPGLRMAVDSSWKHRMSLRVDGVIYDGQARSVFDSYSGGLYILKTKDTIAAVKPQRIHVYGVPYISEVLDGAAAVSHEVDLASTGTINKVESNVTAWFKARAANEVFTQHVQSNTTWTLTGQFQW